MKKIFIILSIFLLASCWTNQQNTNNLNEEKTETKTIKNSWEKSKNLEKINNKEQKINQIAKKDYWDLKNFIDKNLDPQEQKEILKILAQRDERKKQIQEIFNDILENWWFEEKFKKIEEIRETCMNRILPYIDENEKENFIKKCEDLNLRLKIAYYKSLNKKNNNK